MDDSKERKYDLEDRLVDFSILIIDVVEILPNTKASNHLANQLIRSGTSPALNYGEAQSAESKSDFIHKLKIILKELRETRICLRIIKRLKLKKPIGNIDFVYDECNQLISIFVKSIKTVQSRNGKQNIQKK
ncbi:MAG: four helix bundle protein [Bacteroidota bacterium]|nr:four helix bundle protein [Bacteroidota bacterium]